MADDALTTEYIRLLDDLKVRVRAARTQAALAANQELVLLYWHIGRDILERQDALGWGARVVDRHPTRAAGVLGRSPRAAPRVVVGPRSLSIVLWSW